MQRKAKAKKKTIAGTGFRAVGVTAEAYRKLQEIKESTGRSFKHILSELILNTR